MVELVTNHEVYIGYSTRRGVAYNFAQSIAPMPTIAAEEKTSDKVAL